MAESLSFKNHRWRKALIAHALREWFVVWAVVVNFVAELLERHTVLALLISFVFALAFGLNLGKVMLETFMLHELVIGLTNCTVGAFLVRGMLASKLHVFYCFLGDSKTVDTLSHWAVMAVAFLDLLFG